MKKRKVILVTDGDQHVQRALEWLAKQLGGRCISQSQGNPSRLTGKQLVDLILQTPYDPVFVMFMRRDIAKRLFPCPFTNNAAIVKHNKDRIIRRL